MAFFDKLKQGMKSVTDRVTGNYGKVTLELDRTECAPGDTLVATVRLESTGDLKATNVMLAVRGTERLSFNKRLDSQTTVEASGSDENITQDLAMEGNAFEMAPGETRTFTQSITIPTDALPSYKSANLSQVVDVTVRVDVPWGVDLTATQVLTVQNSPPVGANGRSTLSVKTDRLVVNVEFSDYAVLGQSVGYSAAFEAHHEVSIRHILLRARSLETIEARMKTEIPQTSQMQGSPSQQQYSHSQPGQHSDPGTSQPQTIVREENHTYQDELGRSEVVLWSSQRLTPGSKQASVAGLALPNGTGVTFFGRKARHEVVLELEVSLADGRVMKEQAKVVVCGAPAVEVEVPEGVRLEGDSIVITTRAGEWRLPVETYPQGRPSQPVDGVYLDDPLQTFDSINSAFDRQDPAAARACGWEGDDQEFSRQLATFGALGMQQGDVCHLAIDHGGKRILMTKRLGSILLENIAGRWLWRAATTDEAFGHMGSVLAQQWFRLTHHGVASLPGYPMAPPAGYPPAGYPPAGYPGSD